MDVIIWGAAGLVVGLGLGLLARTWAAARQASGGRLSVAAGRWLLFLGLPIAFALPAAAGVGAADRLAAATLSAALLLMAALDLAYRRVPNEIAFPAALLGVVIAFQSTPLAAALTGLAAATVFYLLLRLGERIYGPGALGMGDVKAALAIGCLLGPRWAPVALLLGVGLAGGVAVGLLLSGRGRHDTLPYACCLGLAAAGVGIFAVLT